MNSGTLLTKSKRFPLATYRWQFNRQFMFEQATAAAEYLRDLGVSDAYASPLLQAGPGSTHGYDTCCFNAINPELGGNHGFNALSARLHELGLGLLLDFVPNHMAASLSNPWWVDVLEHGQNSAYARWFDIDWDRPDPGLRGRVLLPILEDPCRKVLKAGKLQLCFEKGRFALCYYERHFPLSPESTLRILARILSHCRGGLELLETAKSLIERSKTCAQAGNLTPAAFAELKQQLGKWYSESAEWRAATAETLRELNGRPGDTRSFDGLHEILGIQHYRLEYWRAGVKRINYRRFFDVSELVALKMELPDLFQAAHELVLELLRAGKLTGLRIDHPDGLWDPKQYFERLDAQAAPIYVVAEKILTNDEPLPPDWPVEGTTGYDFLNRVNGVFVNSSNAEAFQKLYRTFIGNEARFSEIIFECKREVLGSSFVSELDNLAGRLQEITAASHETQGFTRPQLQEALEAIIAAFPVYRTYVTEGTKRPSNQDAAAITQAFESAKSTRTGKQLAALEFLRKLLLLEWPSDFNDPIRKKSLEWIMRFQQLTAPLMAKGLEDTAFYRFTRLLSLNEVGGDPETFGISLAAFHESNASQSLNWPHSLLATATHDTKRGEDARARLNVLSEMPEEWKEAVTRWSRINAGKKVLVGAAPAPGLNDEYLLYQTLLGAWPPDADSKDGLRTLRERITTYLLKATKEAKARTSWIEPDPAYEGACQEFVQKLLADSPSNPFLHDFKPLQQRIAFFGRFNSLAQTLLKLTLPGVPDLYQGSELWDLNLVDPDNRRPVDYQLRKQWLAQLQAEWEKDQSATSSGDHSAARLDFFQHLLSDEQPGLMKLFLIWRSLQFRREHRDLFEQGNYQALLAEGRKREHVCAFARTHGNYTVLTVVPRLVLGLVDGSLMAAVGQKVWQDTFLPLPGVQPGAVWKNVLTSEILKSGQQGLPLATVCRNFPVALLEGSAAADRSAKIRVGDDVRSLRSTA